MGQSKVRMLASMNASPRAKPNTKAVDAEVKRINKLMNVVELPVPFRSNVDRVREQR